MIKYWYCLWYNVTITLQKSKIWRGTSLESQLWEEAQISIPLRVAQSRETETTTLSSILDRWCFTDGSWKDQNSHSGQGWYSNLEGFDGLIGAGNTRASLSPLYSEIEFYFGNGIFEEPTSILGYICVRLF